LSPKWALPGGCEALPQGDVFLTQQPDTGPSTVPVPFWALPRLGGCPLVKLRRIVASVVWLTSLLAAAGAHWKP
jgi:hypothetical protein